MSAPKTTVSVIVPVYNTKTFLNECLESLVHQTLPGIEIILIDDGSNDGSSEICKEYAEKNSFVKYFRQPNSGTVVARQRGLENVSGEYFSFCDSDDFVDPDFYKNLYDAAKAADADVAQCGYSLYFAADDIVRCPDAATARVIQRNEGSAAGIMDVLLLSPPLNVRRVHRTALLKSMISLLIRRSAIRKIICFPVNFSLSAIRWSASIRPVIFTVSGGSAA